MISLVLAILLIILGFSRPIFAKTTTQIAQPPIINNEIYLQKNFEENIKNKHLKAYISFPAKGIAHIKKVKFINSKPIKINIVEINTNLNKNLTIKPEIASTEKLAAKATLRKLAQKQGAIIAINGGYFKPQTGVPLGALMINERVITGSIYNRVGIAIFEKEDDLSFKLENVEFKIKAILDEGELILDNINQPRMLSTYKLLYTKDWGKLSPIAPKNCLNISIKDGLIQKISQNPIELDENSFVIQAPKEIIHQLSKNKKIKIDISLQDSIKEAKHILAGGPYLVKDSQVYVDYKTQKLSAIYGKNPRSAIGFDKHNNLIIVTIDGREESSVGMTLIELARFMKEIGCDYAMNFDGGSSSALYINGKIVNSAVNKEGIAISNALVISETKNENDVVVSATMKKAF